ncbi:MAG: glycosyltransferase family 4 protein [Candidatus Obscuribacterales bacterium]|nr:glycosyltransferase family 4 protein [Candidatus Obscuribacterales bacterium]
MGDTTTSEVAMRIAFSSVSGPDDGSYWSGTPLFMKRHLAMQFDELVHIGPLQLVWQPFKQKHSIYDKMLRKTYIWELEPLVHQYLSMQAARLLKARGRIDLIFSPGSFPYPNAFLETDIPVVFWADASFAGLVEEHPGYRHICEENIWAGHALQQRILDKTTLAIFSSDWAAKTALDRYEFDDNRVAVVPFGANLTVQPPSLEALPAILEQRTSSECRLLFIGRNWIEKGGPFAIDVLSELVSRNIDAKLWVVGCELPKDAVNERLSARVVNKPFLNKHVESDAEQLGELLTASHFLIFPTMGDCFGMVICEANAYGVPVLAHRTGGVASIIRDGQNGFLFAKPQQATDYADCIARLFSDKVTYGELCRTSRLEFQNRLNWTTAVDRVRVLIESL